MNQPFALYNDPETWSVVLKGSVERLHRLACGEGEIFEQHEQYAWQPDADRLGGWVVVASLQPEPLVKEINRKAFPRFDVAETKIENGCYWAHLRPRNEVHARLAPAV
jgi:hypothetical protein